MTFARTEPLSEIIEVIDDDLDAFGGGEPGQPVHDIGGRGRAGPIAAALLVLVVGYGVATSAATSGRPSAAPVTSTSIPITITTVAPRVAPTTFPAAAMPYYAADPPRSFTVQYANMQALDHEPYLGYGYELWATEAASATSGSWFSVMTYRGASTVNAPNPYRVQTDRSSIAISHVEGGHSITQFTVENNFGVTITSFGWTDDDLVRLAGSVQTDGGSVDFTDSWFSADHQMLSSVQPWLAAQSIPAEQVSYVSNDDPTTSIVITVGKRLQTFEGGGATERDIALRFLLDRHTPFEVDGHSAVAGTVVGQGTTAMATWIDGNNLVTVTAALPLPQLIAIARTVHTVTLAEWEGMKFQARGR